MQAKLVHSNVPNSPDSSEESSGGSPNHFTGGSDGPNTDAEESLPSVVSYYLLIVHDRLNSYYLVSANFKIILYFDR